MKSIVKSVKENALFITIYAIVLIPIIAMLTLVMLTGTAVAETANLEEGTEFVFVMSPGESQQLKIAITADNDETTYRLEPDLIISDVDFDDLERINDDWAWNFDEYVNIELGPQGTYELIFEFLPPEGTLAGTYEFIYKLYKNPDETEDYQTLSIKITLT